MNFVVFCSFYLELEKLASFLDVEVTLGVESLAFRHPDPAIGK